MKSLSAGYRNDDIPRTQEKIFRKEIIFQSEKEGKRAVKNKGQQDFLFPRFRGGLSQARAKGHRGNRLQR